VTASYELTDPTVESLVIGLKASGADVLLVAGTPKFASQAIRKAYDIDWKAMIILNYPSSSVIGTLQPAGFEKSVGVVTGAVNKDPDDPRYAKDPAVADYRAFVAKYMPGTNASDSAGRLDARHSDFDSLGSDRPGGGLARSRQALP
jgi:branched-chain amino acid transport system substrate-binding protein